ncbi:hypothetical protein [Actinoallomurus sp. NPDC052274]|uniref:hypothetical protein n=1 Tax=Actinoallomurus sp. NPDC052274 TaxID=3155420 RepID=UPI0034342452
MSNKKLSRLRRLFEHPITRWALGLFAVMVYAVPAAVQLGGSVSQKFASAVMQPLTAGHAVTAVQATTITYLFSTWITAILGGIGVYMGWINEKPLWKASPDTTRRDRVFDGLLSRTTEGSLVHERLDKFKKWEAKPRNRCILTVGYFLAPWLCGNLLAAHYTAVLPFVSGNALTAMGGVVVSILGAWALLDALPLVGLPLPSGGFIKKLRSINASMLVEWWNHNRVVLKQWWDWKKMLPLLLPFGSVAGALVIVVSAGHVAVMPVLAALGGAVCSGVLVKAGKAMANAGIQLQGSIISMLIGLAIGSPTLFTVDWSVGVFVRGIIAGFLSASAAFLYCVAQGRLFLPERVAGVMSAIGPVLSSLVGLMVLHQSLGGWILIGISVMFAVSVITTLFTGSKEEHNAAKAGHFTSRLAAPRPGDDSPEEEEVKKRQPKPQRRSNSLQKRRRKEKAQARGRKNARVGTKGRRPKKARNKH